MYDFLIVGSGIFGSVFAQQARENGKKCLVIDKRSHVGGNCYTQREHQIDIHTYGPHIFHTSSREIWSYVNKFSSFNNYVNRPKARVGNQIFSFPINLMTLHQLWGITTPAEAQKKLSDVRIKCENPRNLEEWMLSQVGKEIYEKFIYGYTKKQWMRDPKELPASIIKRIPIRLTFDDNYFDDTFQGIPTEGYTVMFNNILDGIEVELGVDFFANRDKFEKLSKKIVYTGKIDEFFDFKFGDLQYRGLNFVKEVHDLDFQGNAIINYSDHNVPWTRITEHKHFTPDKKNLDKSVITKEFPAECDRHSTPYYPINDHNNNLIYQKYREFAESCSNVIFGGRLSEYKYYDMHQVVGSALQKSKKYLA
jgi:UDP-galactopyranose mutase